MSSPARSWRSSTTPDELRSFTAAGPRRRASGSSARSPRTSRREIGDAPRPEQRVYVDHSRDIGDYNPCFPLYDLECADDRAVGKVTFPICYGAPRASCTAASSRCYFDCVLQQLNCDLGVAGKTTNLDMRYRRPTPLLTPLRVTAERSLDDDRIQSHAELFLDDELLCTAEMTALQGNREGCPRSPTRA